MRGRVLFLLMTLLTLAAARPVAAQTTTPTDPDMSLIRLGPFAINPSLILRDLGRDENVFNENENPKSDFTFTIVPAVEVVFKPRGMRFAYSAASEYVYYKDYEEERSTNLSSAVRADFTLAWFRPYVLATGANTSQRLNAEVDARALHHERVYGGGVTIKVGSRLDFGASGRTTRLRFEEGSTFRGEDLARSFDSDTDLIEGSAGVQLTPFTHLSINVSREEQTFRLDPARDSESIRVTPLFSFSPEAVLNGSLAIGYRNFKPRSQQLEAFSGFVATATLGTTLWNRHRVETVFGRDIRYSYENDTPYYLATGGNITVTTEIVGPFDVRGTGSHQLLAYRGTSPTGERPGDDSVTSYGGGVGYRIRERLRLGLNAEWTHRDSQLSLEREYRNRRIFVSMTWGREI